MNLVNEMRNELESTGNTADKTEKKIIELKDSNMEMFLVEEEIFKKWRNTYWQLSDFIIRAKIRLMGVSEGRERERRQQGIFKEKK